MEIYVKIFLLFSYFLFFLILKHFIRCIDFTHIALSSTASINKINSCSATRHPGSQQFCVIYLYYFTLGHT